MVRVEHLFPLMKVSVVHTPSEERLNFQLFNEFRISHGHWWELRLFARVNVDNCAPFSKISVHESFVHQAYDSSESALKWSSAPEGWRGLGYQENENSWH